MNCQACHAPLLPPYTFCGACGHKQSPREPLPASLHYALNGEQHELEVDKLVARIVGAPEEDHYVWTDGWDDWKPWREVAELKRRVQRSLELLRERPEAVAAYRRLVAQFAEDGIIEPWEERALQKKRAELDISQTTHDRLLEECLQEARPWLSAAVDARAMTSFRTGYACILRIQLRNVSMEGLASVAVQVSTSSTEGLVHVDAHRIAPAADEVVQIRLQPEVAGQHELELLFVATDYDGTTRRFRSRALAFEVARGESDSGNRVYNVDLSSMQVGRIGNLGVTEEPTGGLLAATSWVELSLSPLTEDEAVRWADTREGRATTGQSGAVRPVEPVRGEPLPCRGALVRILARTGGASGVPEDIWFMQGESFSLGRDSRRADLMAAIEPFEPGDRHRANLEQSRRVSGLHLSLRLGREGAEVCDQKSVNGTLLGGQKLAPHQPTPLAAGAELLLAPHPPPHLRRGVPFAEPLRLGARLLTGDDDFTHVLWLKRLNNLPERSYALAPGGLGLWPGDSTLIGPRTRGGKQAPLVLQWHMRGLVVRNAGLPGVVHVSNTGRSSPIAPRERVALDHNDRIHLDDRWIVHVADLLALRPGG